MKSITFAAALIASVSAWNGHGHGYGAVHGGYGRDQDLSIDESYGKTGAKSYKAESYDQWDNKDNDGWGGQAWGTDKDAAHASSQAYAASAGDKARAAASYGGHAHGYGLGYGYGGPGYGAGYGHGYGGYGKSY